MLTHRHNDNGGGDAATDSHCAPRRIRGPHLQPQRSLTRSLPRRPTAALDPGDLDGPHSAHSAGRPSACPTRARRTRPNKLQDHHKQSLYGFRGLPVRLQRVTEHLCTNGQQSTYTILKERVLGFGPSPSSYLQSCQRRTSQRRVPLILVAGSESNDGGPVGAAPHPHGHAPAGGGRCRTSGNRFGNEGLRTAPCVAELSSMGSSVGCH